MATTFKEFLVSAKPLTRKQMNEGGNAIKTSSRINQLNVDATLASIYSELLPKLGLAKKDVVLLGSTGKKNPDKNGTEEGSSGDIDLGISIEAVMDANGLKDSDSVYGFLKKVGGSYDDVKSFPGLGVVSVAYPISNTDGLQAKKIVQLDLMPVENLKYAEWAYHSPRYDESEYKALYQKEIFYACARVAQTKEVESAEVDGTKIPVVWDRIFFDLGKGLMGGRQSIKGKTKIVKTATTSDKHLITDDPKKIVSTLFGPKVKPSDVLTWEGAWKAINSKDFLLKDKLAEILDVVKRGIENKGYPVPKELKNAISGV